MRFVAPAGTPIPLPLYAGALLEGLSDTGAAGRLADSLARQAGRQQGFLFSTGRAAMVVALQALREIVADPRRDEVIVAGYTCYSVPASVLRAGLRPRLCDVDPRTLSLDPDDLRRFDTSKVMAIVTANLYGIPNALRDLEAWARAHGIALLDDAAQALGARIDGRPAGGFGDLGLYSLDKGKNITSLEGGALVASNPTLIEELRRRHGGLPRVGASSTARTVAKLAIYSVLLRPWLYGITQKLPFLGLGLTRYEDDYPLQRYPNVLAGFGNRLFARLPELTRIRARNAQRLRDALAEVPALKPIALLPGSEPGYTRFPVLADARERPALIAALQAAGIGATASYPAALCDVPELDTHLHPDDRRLAGARDVAARIVTLPVHPYCQPDHADIVVRALNRRAPHALPERTPVT